MDTPTITDEGYYEFFQSVNGGYLQNSTYAYHNIVSVWKKDLTLVSLTIDGADGFTDNYHKNRAKCAKNRHLKWLKIYLGLEKETISKKERFIYRDYWEAELQECEIELSKKGTPKFSSHNTPYVKYTKELWKLAEEYNKKLSEWKTLKNTISKQLFKR